MTAAEYADLKSVERIYSDHKATHQHIHSSFTDLMVQDPQLLNHRLHIEKYKLGFGDRAFHWLWKLIVDSMPAEFKFLEIGVYKGQVLSLVGMLSISVGKKVDLYGLTPLKPLGDKFSHYDDADYDQAIRDLQIWSGIPESRLAHIIEGLSDNEEVKQDTQRLGPYDVVYIDGCHDYAVVVNDILTYGEMVPVGGLLIMDDAATELDLPDGIWPGHPDVGRAVRNVLDPDPRFEQVVSVGHIRVWRRKDLDLIAAPTAKREPSSDTVPGTVTRPLFQAGEGDAEAMSMSPRSKNLILGYCAGYSIDKVEAFLASFARHVESASLCLFALDMDLRFHEVARLLNVTIIDPASDLDRSMHVMNARFFLFRDFLKRYYSLYESILITDIRDVIFQSDPFEVDRNSAVSFAAEDNTIARCPWNSKWIEEVYGADTLTTLGNKTISCAGTTIGSSVGILHYVQRICEEILAMNADRMINYDQGIHNYIVHTTANQYGSLDRDGRIVATVGYTPERDIEIEGSTILVRATPAPIVHQWDRHPKLVKHLEEDPGYALQGIVSGSPGAAGFRPDTFRALQTFVQRHKRDHDQITEPWEIFLQELSQNIIEGKAHNFFRWSLVQRVLAPVDGPMFQIYYEEMRASGWLAGKRASARDVEFGTQNTSAANPRMSPVHIRHLYHLWTFERRVGLKPVAFGTVVEFGGGYGNFTRLLRASGFKGRYIIFDLPLMNRVQHMFLEAANVTAVILEDPEQVGPVLAMGPVTILVSDLILYRSLLEQPEIETPLLLVGTWSLSEAPTALRDVFIYETAWDYLLAAYQPAWETIRNDEYFEDIQETFAETHHFITIPVPHDPEQVYMFGMPAAALPVLAEPGTPRTEDLVWEQVPGHLASVSIASDGTVWGTAKDGTISRYVRDIATWEQIPGRLRKVAVGSFSEVWGLTEAGDVLRYAGEADGWVKIPVLFQDIAAGAGEVWGITPDGEIRRLVNDL